MSKLWVLLNIVQENLRGTITTTPTVRTARTMSLLVLLLVASLSCGTAFHVRVKMVTGSGGFLGNKRSFASIARHPKIQRLSSSATNNEGDDQTVKDLNLSEMFDLFDAADDGVPGDSAGKTIKTNSVTPDVEPGLSNNLLVLGIGLGAISMMIITIASKM
mmetsp:Transcript_7371/g.12245  ORF Transcript_7371/g.12245 Transcript_7371/m.12245 type:complete len:161 (-) Transcript_7371:1416-1898(-)